MSTEPNLTSRGTPDPDSPPPVRQAILGFKRNSPVLALIVLGGADAVLAVAAWLLVSLIAPTSLTAVTVTVLAATSILTQLVVGILTGLYLRRLMIGSTSEFRLQVLSGAITLLVVLLVNVVASLGAHVFTVLGAELLTIVLATTSRHLARLYLDHQRRPRVGVPVVVVGAGLVGVNLVDQMLRDPRGAYLPVAFVDDDPRKRRFRFRGVRVKGTVAQTAQLIQSHGAEGAVVAIGHSAPTLYASLAEQLADSRAWVRTVPSASEMLEDPADVASLRDIDVTDLIGRPVAPPDLTAAREMLRGRRILVTGAGGSIGSELCRQISALEPGLLVMLDRDETALHHLQMSLTGRALLDTPDLVLADIRDRSALDAVFAKHRPEIVFHAAALKHLPLLQSHPQEGWKTNVHGTQNVIDAAIRHQVQTFVNVSTDKAAHPTSTLGTSKRVAEGLTSSAAARTGRAFVSVRFGNVIGSRGSAIPAFAEQIRKGGPITVTHPEVTRYFMTIPEACALVLFAGSVGRAGETLVLDMGRPVRIADVAQRMMMLMGARCTIEYTGLRPGEKLHEVLFTPDETEVVDRHDRVFHVINPGIDPDGLPVASAPTELIDEYVARSLGVTFPPREVTPR
ncbi:polysaccharide biosynthesis protein [Brachybacterium subflavum]|uniref:polysaccharide biosynthesis protein n=1 Tax=Brachybacterium subflavum TaxID=2585206 RepID=UPI0012660BEA|nr:polysaccharide biosynthesis protein [Brachybacterium subflavum]